jgi:hypothetical protein
VAAPAANFLAFYGDAMRRIAEQFLRLAEKQKATVPRIIGHRVMGMTELQETSHKAEHITIRR